MDDALLRIENISLTLDGQQILRDLSLSMVAGEYVSLVGPNGAGKSSLLKVVLGVMGAQSGAVSVKGRLIDLIARRELARSVAYVPQNGQGVFPHSAYDFVMLGRFAHSSFLGVLGAHDKDVVRSAMQMTGTLEYAARPLCQLSGGERQRVVIAAALAQEPELLLLDEVCHFLDPKHQAEIEELLLRINRAEGVAILSVTHDINEAALNSRRILALQQGSLVFDGKPAEFLRAEILRMVFERDFLLVPHPARELSLVVPAGSSR